MVFQSSLMETLEIAGTLRIESIASEANLNNYDVICDVADDLSQFNRSITCSRSMKASSEQSLPEKKSLIEGVFEKLWKADDAVLVDYQMVPEKTEESFAENTPAPYITGASTALCTQSKLAATQTAGLSQFQVVAYLVTATIGIGVVVLPSLMKLGGWIVPLVVSVLVYLGYMEMAMLLDDAIDAAEVNIRMDSRVRLLETRINVEGSGEVKAHHVSSFEDLAFATLGERGIRVVRAIVVPGFFGNVLVFAILVGENLADLFHASRKTMLFIATVILVPLAVIKDSSLAKVMSLGMLCSLASCVLICCKGVMDADIWSDWPQEDKAKLHSSSPKEWSSLGTILAILFSAYSVLGTVPCVRGQMADKSKFKPAFRQATTLVFIVYSAVMACGYYGYGNGVRSSVVETMMAPPRSACAAGLEEDTTNCGASLGQGMSLCSEWIAIAMNIFSTIYLFLGFALFFKCFAGLIEKFGGGNPGPCFVKDSSANWVLRVLVCLVVVAVAVLVPSFRVVLAIVSSICCPCNNIFFPLLFDYYLRAPARRHGHLKRLLHCGIALLGVFCMTLGLYHSVSELF